MQGGRAEPIGRGGNTVICLVVANGGVFQVGFDCLSLPVPFYLHLNKNSHPLKLVSVGDNADPICFLLGCFHEEPAGSSWGVLSYWTHQGCFMPVLVNRGTESVLLLWMYAFCITVLLIHTAQFLSETFRPFKSFHM